MRGGTISIRYNEYGNATLAILHCINMWQSMMIAWSSAALVDPMAPSIPKGASHIVFAFGMGADTSVLQTAPSTASSTGPQRAVTSERTPAAL
jgi:hypothetical protein